MDPEWIAFMAGVIIGGACGISIMALLVMSRQSDIREGKDV